MNSKLVNTLQIVGKPTIGAVLAAIASAGGVILGDPYSGALIGAGASIIQDIFKMSLDDFCSRQLSQKEDSRIGNAALYAINKIRELQNEGYPLRDDGFFDRHENEQSDAEEILEGVLLKCKNEHEEKKLKYIANIYANIAFMDNYTIAEANRVINLVEGLTYQQFCIIALFKRRFEIHNICLRNRDFKEKEELIQKPTGLFSLLSNLNDMLIRNIIFIVSDFPGNPYNNFEGNGGNIRLTHILNIFDLIPNNVLLHYEGEILYRMLNLEEIPEDDIMTVARYLE